MFAAGNALPRAAWNSRFRRHPEISHLFPSTRSVLESGTRSTGEWIRCEGKWRPERRHSAHLATTKTDPLSALAVFALNVKIPGGLFLGRPMRLASFAA